MPGPPCPIFDIEQAISTPFYAFLERLQSDEYSNYSSSKTPYELLSSPCLRLLRWPPIPPKKAPLPFSTIIDDSDNPTKITSIQGLKDRIVMSF